MTDDLDQLRTELDQARATISQLERRQRIDDLLRDAQTIDLDAARLLTEVAVTQMSEPDVAVAVADLKRHKPYLFRERHDSPPLMPARHDSPDPAADDAAQRAAATGDRRDLLRYLRLRRCS
jgi:hypothetical protein